jgi:uncharacterized membrane protein YraQ (UPF0718 family)
MAQINSAKSGCDNGFGVEIPVGERGAREAGGLASLLVVASPRVKTSRIWAHPGLIFGVLATIAVFVAGLLWAKWLPYAAKAQTAQRTHHWSGSNILSVGGVRAGDAPTWHAATTFFHAYFASIWQALVVALLVSACIQAFLPRAWLPRVLNRRRTLSSALAGGAASMPSMMCTCCAAPVAVTLRRSGVTPAAALAYWLGNPMLNPAVLGFLLFVAPWQWTLTRLLVGAATVFGVAALVGVMTRNRDTEHSLPEAAPDAKPDVAAPERFVRALVRLCLVMLPEYAVIVLVIGACRGWLLTLTQPAHHGLLIVLITAIVGTFMVLPTAGEIPILLGLALLGVSSGVIGALLITLPVVSLPGVAMVSRSFGWKAISTTIVAVIAAGLVGATVLSVI